MRVVGLTPRRADGGRRDVVAAWIRNRWETEHPEWPLIEGHHNDGPFNRSEAINRAAEAAGEWDVAIITDADSFVGPDQLDQAVDLAARTGQITFAYDSFRYLNRPGSKQIMAGYLGDWFPFVEWTLTGTCSSMVVVPRSLWDQAGGFDPGFRGWGMEDVGFSLACQALGGGMQRVPGTVWHLFHAPSTENHHESPYYQANVDRMNRYRGCDYDPEKMAALLSELR